MIAKNNNPDEDPIMICTVCENAEGRFGGKSIYGAYPETMVTDAPGRRHLPCAGVPANRHVCSGVFFYGR
jgi:hypothetical protein